MLEIPIYDVVFDDHECDGMTAVSFVDDPAIEQNFVYYRKQGDGKEIPVAVFEINKEKHEVVSPILIPNQLIKRYDDFGKVYYMRWSKDVIQKVMYNYLFNKRNNNVTIMHPLMYDDTLSYQDCLEKDVYMLDMWIVQDEQKDIINSKYGFHVPQGTLCVRYKIHNRKLWQRIKSGELKGLSIEAYCGLTRSASLTLQNKQNKTKENNTKMTKKKKISFVEKLIAFANDVKSAADELATIATTDETDSGEPELKYETADNDTIIVKSDGMAYAGDGSAMQAGEYALVDGSVLVVDENGKFAGTKTVDETTETPQEAPIAEAEDDKKKRTCNAEEDKEKQTDSETTTETSDEEKKKEDVNQEDVPPTLVPIIIDDMEYLVPQEVADHIKDLEEKYTDSTATAETFRKELAQIKAKTPSAKPIQSPINQSNSDKNSVDYNAFVEKLNRYRK